MPKNNPAPNSLTPRAERLVRGLSTFTVAVLAVAAAVLSFAGLRDLALQAGFSPELAWLMPVIIDGMVLTGSLGVVVAGLVNLSTWYPWMLTLLGVSVSIAGNVAAAPPNLTAQLVHAIAPITFALSIEGMLRIYRASAHAVAHRDAAAVQAEERKAEREMRALERTARLASLQAHSTSVGSLAAPQTSTAPIDLQTGTSRERIKTALEGNPEFTAGQIARALNIDPSYTRKIVRELRPQRSAQEPQPEPNTLPSGTNPAGSVSG
jgi:hypothetical protein